MKPIRKVAPPRSPAPTKATPPIGDNLCELCSKALIIDDLRAGGSVATPSDGTAAALDFSGFRTYLWDWKTIWNDFYYTFSCHSLNSRESNKSGHAHRTSYAGIDFERAVTAPKLSELSTTSAPACQFCCILKRLFISCYKKQPWWQGGSSTLRFQIRYVWNGLSRGPKHILDGLFVMVCHPGLSHDMVDGFKFHVGALQGTCREWLRIEEDPYDIRGRESERNHELVEGWIQDCVTHHHDCEAWTSGSGFVPKRLLDLCPASTDSDPEPDLVLVNVDENQSQSRISSSSGLRYATLSYCWGQSPPLKTTSESLARHKQGIFMYEMPRVFQEAVFVARKLGVRYLWIDALCIIQDSQLDWEQESVRMSDIFAHSFITIAAAAATSCQESFLLRSTEYALTIPFRSSLRPEIFGEYSIFLLEAKELGYDIARGVDIWGHTWNHRAWVLQEQRMASRLLVFGKSMLQMVCRNGTRLEQGAAFPGVFPRDVQLEEWNRIVREYSARDITSAHDRLAAVSGLARYISSKYTKGKGPEYLAGIWNCSSKQLCWIHDPPEDTYSNMMKALTVEKEFCAPSWSWASRNRAALFFGDLYPDKNLEITRFDMRPANFDTTIAVKPGSSVTLKGNLRKLARLPSEGRFVRGSSGPFRDDRYSGWKVTFSGSYYVFYYLDWVLDLNDPCEKEIQRELQSFIIQESTYEGTTYTTGLLLIPFYDLQGTVFRRVGVFTAKNCDLWSRGPDVEVTIV